MIFIGDIHNDFIVMRPHLMIADQFEIKADVPGVSKQDIKLNVDADVLSISVDKAQKKVSLLPPAHTSLCIRKPDGAGCICCSLQSSRDTCMHTHQVPAHTLAAWQLFIKHAYKQFFRSCTVSATRTHSSL